MGYFTEAMISLAKKIKIISYFKQRNKKTIKEDHDLSMLLDSEILKIENKYEIFLCCMRK